jgi:hypothetical protein
LDSSSSEDDLEAARSKDAAQATGSEELVVEGRLSHPRLAWLTSPEMTAPRTTAGATHVPRGRCRRLPCLGYVAVGRPLRERCHRLPAASRASSSLVPGGAPPSVACLGAARRWPPGSTLLARPTELPPLKPNPWRRGCVFIAAQIWSGSTGLYRLI